MDDLRERADAFWAARVEGDLIKAYEYESGKVTGTPTLQQYIRKSSLIYRKAAVTAVERESDTVARVSVQVEYQIPAFTSKPLHSELNDRWVLLEGAWWHEAKPRKP